MRSDHEANLVHDGSVLPERQKNKGAIANPMNAISASRLWATCTTEVEVAGQPGSHGKTVASSALNPYVPTSTEADLKRLSWAVSPMANTIVRIPRMMKFRAWMFMFGAPVSPNSLIACVR